MVGFMLEGVPFLSELELCYEGAVAFVVCTVPVQDAGFAPFIRIQDGCMLERGG
jgi:hypothetical protein